MKTLRMKFVDADGKAKMISLNYARENVTAGEVEDAMDTLMTQSLVPGAVGLSGADLVDRTVTPLF